VNWQGPPFSLIVVKYAAFSKKKPRGFPMYPLPSTYTVAHSGSIKRRDFSTPPGDVAQWIRRPPGHGCHLGFDSRVLQILHLIFLSRFHLYSRKEMAFFHLTSVKTE
jgi:hypothetical protein